MLLINLTYGIFQIQNALETLFVIMKVTTVGHFGEMILAACLIAVFLHN